MPPAPSIDRLPDAWAAAPSIDRLPGRMGGRPYGPSYRLYRVYRRPIVRRPHLIGRPTAASRVGCCRLVRGS